ncbi:MAG: glycosyl hydrolase [Pedosphaera sp.]|nr:glycosyl hydrolase [Pedosphaera sp.]
MAIQLNHEISPQSLVPKIRRLWKLSGPKIQRLQSRWETTKGTPVFTERGVYATRGWTEWTQGFQFGSALLHYEATGQEKFLAIGLQGTRDHMATHVSHTGVHDHGFNNVSTYGNLWRMACEGTLPLELINREAWELALKVSGAVQAARWTSTAEGGGYIYSFNGPHSLFIDTLRSLRSLALAHQLGHVLMSECDRRVSLLDRLVMHLEATVRYNVFFGTGRDAYDVRGRVAHEAIFNTNDGRFRCPNSQQGYSPLTTWTRGLAWGLCGLAEQWEFLISQPAHLFSERLSRAEVLETVREAAVATAEFYISQTPTCGVPYWDTGAPSLVRLGDYLNRAADPFNEHEPVDSSAAAIAAQGLLRLGRLLGKSRGKSFWQAGLKVADTLFSDPYLSSDEDHEGLLLHSVYHRPNGWDSIALGQKVPNGESSMWGDYHLRELALLIQREAQGQPWLRFF